ncbi:MMPL family protein [Mycobacterium intracellulare MIN_052511_1280]|nr:MMPL family protein [Mycobacterium intracellulare MIN_052511_1280]
MAIMELVSVGVIIVMLLIVYRSVVTMLVSMVIIAWNYLPHKALRPQRAT